MRLLLDSHAFVWFWAGSRRLGKRTRTAIEREATTVGVSIATIWELAIKTRIRRIESRDAARVWVPRALETTGFTLLPITLEHVLAVETLPDHHRDPFDRLLIAQARADGLTLVTANAVLADYDVKVLDART